jgi:predicted SprT family Zn-dependent metalloprotease
MNPLFIQACCEVVHVRKPVQIRFNPKAKGVKDAAAYYESRLRKGKIIGHVIFVNLDITWTSNYSLQDVIAHEICHAAQFENGLYKEGNLYHDEAFQAICKLLKKALQKTEYKVGPLYNPKVDIE